MKLFFSYIQRILMLAAVVSMLVACHDQDLPDFGGEDAQGCVALRITLGSASGASGMRAGAPRRVSPNGGEYGDGLEQGQHQENDIHSLMLYAYSGSINSDASTPVRLVANLTDLHLNSENMTIEGGMITHEVRVDDKFINGYIFNPTDKFIIVANMQVHAMTLGELRNAYVMSPLQRVTAGHPMSECSDFVMSNERESSYVSGIGSAEMPHLIKVAIERVTARVDLVTTGAVMDASKQALHYLAQDGTSHTTVGSVFVSHARVFNAMRAPSYLIKRLADSESGHSIYLGDEANPANRIVVEPNTWQKGTSDAATLSGWYGESHLSYCQQQGDSWFRDADRVHFLSPSADNDGFGTSVSTDEAGMDYYVLDYVNENTMTAANTRGKVTTGILLRAVYKPERVYGALNSEQQPLMDLGYSYGQTFWRYRPLTAAYDETKALYFSNEATAEAYRSAHPDIVAEITEYHNAMCYYPVFLRHDNTLQSPDAYAVSMMEFGIVRNNIYRLKVGFTGPGYPTLTEIDRVDPEGIQPYIFVRRWYKIIHPEIEL